MTKVDRQEREPHLPKRSDTPEAKRVWDMVDHVASRWRQRHDMHNQLESAKARIAELEKALRDIIEDVDHEDHVKGDWSWVVVVKRARRVLAAAQPEKKEG